MGGGTIYGFGFGIRGRDIQGDLRALNSELGVGIRDLVHPRGFILRDEGRTLWSSGLGGREEASFGGGDEKRLPRALRANFGLKEETSGWNLRDLGLWDFVVRGSRTGFGFGRNRS